MASVREVTLLDEVADFIASLPTQQRLALLQRKYGKLDYPEIARNLGCTDGEARAAIYAALRKLRDQFGDRL